MPHLIGEKERPYLRVPAGFSEDGLPYGAFCKCARCGTVARSTNAFDYYAKDGELLCGACLGHDHRYHGAMIERDIDQGNIDCDPLGPGCRGGYDESLG
jgi:hypothetical protein